MLLAQKREVDTQTCRVVVHLYYLFALLKTLYYQSIKE